MTEPTPESPSAAEVIEGGPHATGKMADPNVPAGEQPPEEEPSDGN